MHRGPAHDLQSVHDFCKILSVENRIDHMLQCMRGIRRKQLQVIQNLRQGRNRWMRSQDVVRNAQNQRVVKCECGHEFGDYRQNWKLGCKVRVRRTAAAMREVYDPAPACPEPGWQEIREFFCPDCATQHAVEVVAPGYPAVFEMLPDLDKFYRDYLGIPLPDEAPDWYTDRTEQVTQRWAANAAG